MKVEYPIRLAYQFFFGVYALGALMELEFLTKEQSLDFFNNKTGLNVDINTFFIYCLEHELPIKYKALTTFLVIKGFKLSQYEYEQLRVHINLADDETDTTIFAQDTFEQQCSSLCYEFYKKNFENEFNSNLPLIQMKALEKSSTLMRETDEYKKLLEKKDSIDRVNIIKKREKLLKTKNGVYIFHISNQETLNSGIYEFLDSSLTSRSILENKILNNFFSDESHVDSSNGFLKINDEYYIKASLYRNDEIFGKIKINNKEIFQEGILKTDIEKLIEKMVGLKVKSDILHTRTANNASKIISALCELNGLDLTKPFGDANKTIMETLERLDAPLSKDVIGEWLKLAHENTK